ncbi:hypothetical protein J6590_061562 [Homalodisca vitripennis]|nr:hypothetical protein J6590_061562 [Homalodisca vitripennis]
MKHTETTAYSPHTDLEIEVRASPFPRHVQSETVIYKLFALLVVDKSIPPTMRSRAVHASQEAVIVRIFRRS